MNRTLFSATIRLDADRFTRPLGRARRELGAFGDQADRSSRRFGMFGRTTTQQSSFVSRAVTRSMAAARFAASRFERGLGFLERRMMALGRIVKYNLLFGGVGLGVIFTGGVAAGIRFNATMEQNVLAFEQFLGSAKAARRELRLLQVLAERTPFELPQLTQSARGLLAAGFSARQTNKYLRTLADTAAAFGTPPEGIDRMVLAIQQIAAAGRLQGDELRQLQEVGPPVYRIIRKELGLTADQMGRIGELAIPAERVIPALFRGLNRLYGGASERQSKTFFGLWSSLKDNANQALGSITRGVFDESKDWLGSLNRFAKRANAIWTGPGSFSDKASAMWKDLTGSLTRWLDGGGEAEIAAGARKFGEIFAGAINTVFGVGADTGGTKSPFYRAGSTAVTSFAKGFKDSLATGEILTSPLGRILEGYLLLKFGPRLFRRMGGAGGGGTPGVPGAVDRALGQAVYWRSPMPVVVVGGAGIPGGVAPVPGGGKGPRNTPLPYPGAPGRTPPTSRVPRLPPAVGAVGRFLVPVALAQMAADAAFRPDHNPAGSAVDLGKWIGGKISRDTPERSRRIRRDFQRFGLGPEPSRIPKGFFGRRERRATRDAPSPMEEVLGIKPGRVAFLANLNQKATQRVNKVTLSEAVKNRPALRKAGRENWRAFAQGVRSPNVLSEARASGAAVINATAQGVSGAVPRVTATPANAPGIQPGDLPGYGAGTGDAPGPRAGTAYRKGQQYGRQISNAFAAGAASTAGATMPPTATPSAGGGTPGGIGGNWGGSMPLALGLARLSGLPVVSQKRNTKFTASGGISDHWIGSTDAYAVDLATTPPAGDPIAQRLGAALGVPDYRGGYWLNRSIGGYRYQLGRRVPDHFDHIHAGVNRLHGGGQFRAPSPGGEGIAILRDRERVVPASGAGSRPSGASVGQLNVYVTAAETATADPDTLAGVIATKVSAAIENITIVPPED